MKSDFKLLKAILSLDDSLKKTNKNAEKQEAEIKKHNSEIENINKDIKDNQAEISKTKKDIQETAKELEKKIENIKIKVPKDGKDGRDGKDGKNGFDGKPGKDGKDGINGKDGADGKDGINGKDGKDGTGIQLAKVNDAGDLILVLSNKKQINCGHVKGTGGANGLNGYNGRDGSDGVSVEDAKIENSHLIITLSNGTEIDAGYVGGGGSEITSYNDLNDKPTINGVELAEGLTLADLGIDIPERLSELTDDATHRLVTDAEKTAWNNKSDFSGNYNDLENKPNIPNKTSDLTNDSGFITKDVNNLTNYTKTSELSNVATSGNYEDLSNKPTIPVVPTNVSAFTNDAGYLTQHQDISGKYDKTGGEISGNVKIDGTLTLDIEDEDYDAGIRFDKRLDDNLGTVLTLTGYANGDEPTSYKPIIRNVGTPNSAYDVANKKYVDDNLLTPNYYLTLLNADGTIDTTTSTLNYNTVLSNLTNRAKADYLDVIWNTTRFYAKCIEVTDVNTGDLKFIGEVEYQGIQRYMVFTLNPSNVLATTNIITFETISDKVQSVVSNSTSVNKYPSTKAVFDEFQRKPAVVWETDTNFLNAIQADITENPAWQLTGLDMTPFKRIKIYSKAGKGRTTAGATGGMILEMSLDSRAGFADYGGNFVGSVLVQKPNDANRYASLTCAVSADKTKFVVLRQTSLYGTAATTNNDIGADVFKIEGYYD